MKEKAGNPYTFLFKAADEYRNKRQADFPKALRISWPGREGRQLMARWERLAKFVAPKLGLKKWQAESAILKAAFNWAEQDPRRWR